MILLLFFLTTLSSYYIVPGLATCDAILITIVAYLPDVDGIG